MTKTLSRFRDSLDIYSALFGVFAVGLLVPAIMLFTAVLGFPSALTAVFGIVCGIVLFLVGVPLVPAEWTDVIRTKPLAIRIGWGLVIVVVVVLLARLALFIDDPYKVHDSLDPNNTFMVEHTHMSGYISGVWVAEHDPRNLYNIHRYSSPNADSILPSIVPMQRDVYVYPPPFLLLPRIFTLFTSSFVALRATWYVLYILTLLAATLGVARWVGGRVGAALAVLTPLIWISLPTLSTLQVGNIHVMLCYVGAVTAMVLFYRGRHVLGGAALGFAIVAKVSPGILVLYLLIQRRWRPAAWTAGWCVIYSVLSYAIFGWGPWRSFLSDGTWKNIASGKFFDFVLDVKTNQLINYAPFGIPYKLGQMGWHFGNPHSAGLLIANIYTVLVLALVVAVALRLYRRARVEPDTPLFRAENLAVWLGILTLASFREPFGPWLYIAVGAIWLFAVYSAGMLNPTRINIAVVAIVWAVVALYLENVYFTLSAQLILYVAVTYMTWRAASGTARETVAAEEVSATAPERTVTT